MIKQETAANIWTCYRGTGVMTDAEIAEIYQIEGFKLQDDIKCCATCAFGVLSLWASSKIRCAQSDNQGQPQRHPEVQPRGICPRFEAVY